jgi:hypothetical protein
VPHSCHFQRRTVHIGADSCTTESRLDQGFRRIAAVPGIAPEIFPKLTPCGPGHHDVVIRDVARVPESADAASWVGERIVGFAESVLSLVPGGFDAYARIFHPACPGGSFANLRPGQLPVSWGALAASMGTTAHRAMQWPSVIGTYKSSSYPRLETHPGVEPSTGSLPLPVSRIVMELLKGHTTTPDKCWFAVWEGSGALGEFVRSAPTFDLPNRTYHLLAGAIDTVLESVEDPPPAVVDSGEPWPHYDSPNLWWPEDHAWCVATEIDLQSTYVAGSRACIDSLLAEHRLEIYEVESSDGMTWADDDINRKPDEEYR